MKTDKIIKRKAAKPWVCAACEAAISKGESHFLADIFVKADDVKPKQRRYHTGCWGVIDSLGLLNEEYGIVTPFTFSKRCREYIYNAYQKLGQGERKPTKKELLNVPAQRLSEMIQNFIKHTGGVGNSEFSDKVVKEWMAMSDMFMSFTMVMDDFISDLTEKGLYARESKRRVNHILKDIEGMSNRLFRLFNKDKSEANKLIFNSGITYDEIQRVVTLDGLERSTNILIGYFKVMAEKYKVVRTECAVDGMLEFVDQSLDVIRSVTKDVPEHKAVEFLISQATSINHITLTK